MFDYGKFQVEYVENDHGVIKVNNNYQFNRFDEHKLSWTGWTYKSYLPDQSETDFMPICTGCGDGLFWSNSDRDPEHPNW